MNCLRALAGICSSGENIESFNIFVPCSSINRRETLRDVTHFCFQRRFKAELRNSVNVFINSPMSSDAYVCERVPCVLANLHAHLSSTSRRAISAWNISGSRIPRV